jgi:F0F1-type ATP synthase delta subunit
LPPSLVTPSDISRLLSELEVIEDKMLQQKARKSDDAKSLPTLSKRLESVVDLNKFDLLQPEDRQALKAFLLDIKQKAPLLHISFSSEPSTTFLDKLVVWLRREINPHVLLSIGLQPAIGAGCIVRTTNKYFDLSLRQTFIAKRPLLLEQIVPAAAVPETAPEATAA